MSISTEILSLRRVKSSSVETLLGLLEWQHSTKNKVFTEMRSYSVAQAADLVLMNVAIHAREAQDDVPPARETRRTRSFWRKLRRSGEPQLKGHRRFA